MRIKRFRGDTYSETFILQINGSPANLDLISAPQLAVRKTSGVQVLSGIKDADAASGRVVFGFTEQIAQDIGVFAYDIQGVFTGGLKITFVKDTISFADDVNKT